MARYLMSIIDRYAILTHMKDIIIIGSGFSSLSAACYLGKRGYKVTIFEKNQTIGGRARQLKQNGFTFDMGPTFYWMPDIFESFFRDFGKTPSDFYELTRLDPGYTVYFGFENSLSVSADIEQIYNMFETRHKGSSRFLSQYLKAAEFNYRTAIDKVVYKPGKSIFELIMPETAIRIPQFIQSINSKIKHGLDDPQLRQLLEFPVLFLGAKPSRTPAFYSFMNYADMILGTWHIKGGMFKLVEAMRAMAEDFGVKIYTDTPVERIIIEHNMAKGVEVKGEIHRADLIISGADYHHTECLIEEEFRNYSESYWQKRVFAPSALLYYVAFNKKLKNVSHHTLFFDTDFQKHSQKIYDDPDWPETPLFYASFPSITDSTVSPEGKEIGIFLIPIAPGLNDTEDVRKKYFDQIIERLEHLTAQSVKEDILFSHTYAVSDFVKDYNAYKGNAYGLANTLTQTAFMKPKMQNKKISNLFYTGQLTVPGPGVPPAIISGKIVANLADRLLNSK